MDFVRARFADGRWFRTLTVPHMSSRECVTLVNLVRKTNRKPEIDEIALMDAKMNRNLKNLGKIHLLKSLL